MFDPYGQMTTAEKIAAEETRSLADRAYQQLEEGIVTLRLKPGTLCTEAELSSMLGIGRTPIREALKRLEERRLVQNIPRLGVKITEINVADHFSLLETRRVLDQLIASKAARRATPAQRSRLRELADQMQTAMQKNDLITYMHVDRAFDELLESAARNPFAASAAAVLHAHCRRFWYYYKHDGDISEIAQLHIHLMQAVAAGDETAAATASDAIIEYMEKLTKSSLDIT